MRTGYLFVVMILVNLNNLFANLQPLDFDIKLPVNHVASLLLISTKLFHDINRLDLGLPASLDQITSHLIDLIGAIYIYNHHAREQQAKHEDLCYLLDLLSDANLAFYNLQHDANLAQNQFIINLFWQVEQLLATRSNLHQLYR